MKYENENTPRDVNYYEIPASAWWNENFPYCQIIYTVFKKKYL